MKLELHLIPESTFYGNLRNKIGRQKWTTLSKKIRKERDYTCDICGAKEGQEAPHTHLHEVWEFDEDNKVQKLSGFECLCPDCHAVHHWGLSQIRGSDMIRLMRHACSINGCSEEYFHRHILEAFDTWRQRSTINWTVDTSILNEDA